ncbi:UbiD family decarboxylase [Candidatus Auribacterota bacterium]
MKKLKSKLAKIKEIKEPLKRRLFALAVITKALEETGIKPILIGGCALEYYSFGGYTTGDVDLALPHVKAVEKVFEGLGFKNKGRYWTHDRYDLMIEAPTSNIAGETANLTEVQIDGMKCFIIGVEDLIIDRLNSYVYWKWEDDGRWVKRLIELNKKILDVKYLKKRAKEEGTIKSLEKILKG